MMNVDYGQVGQGKVIVIKFAICVCVYAYVCEFISGSKFLKKRPEAM